MALDSYHHLDTGPQSGDRDTAPLFFTFHGTGGDERQFVDLAQTLAPDARIVSPRGDVSEFGALRFFRRSGEGIYDMDDLAKRTAAMAAFMAAQKATTQPSGTIGLGYSNGANILASVLLEAPEIVDTAVLMHPLIPWAPAPQPGLAGRRVLITAGRHDPICPPEWTVEFADYLTDQGAQVTLDWHDGGHEIRQEEIASVQAFLNTEKRAA